MSRQGGRGAAAVVALVLLTCLPSLAEDGAEGFDSDFGRAKKLVQIRKWKPARKAFGRLFLDYERQPVVLRHLEEIEEDLKLCLFKLAAKEPTGEQLFGNRVKKWGAQTRRIEFEYSTPEASEDWTVVSETYFGHNVVFEGEVTLEFRQRGTGTTSAILMWDVEKGGGYRVCPGYQWQDSSTVYSLDRNITRIDGDERKDLFRKSQGSDTATNFTVRYTRKGSSISVKVGRKQVAKASDGRYRRGSVAINLIGQDEGQAYPVIDRVKLSGKVEKDYLERVRGEWETAALKRWQKRSWNRDKVIPGWARSGEVRATAGGEGATALEASLLAVPADGSKEVDPSLRAALRLYFDGHRERFLAAADDLTVLPTSTQYYLDGLVELSEQEYEQAEASFDLVVDEDPHFAPGHAGLGEALFHQNRYQAARASLEQARDADPLFPTTWALLARITIYGDQDVTAAGKLLDAAVSKGIKSYAIDEVREWIARARRGPRWSKRYEHKSLHFLVASDHSKEICVQVAKLLESSLTAYSANFETLTKRQRSKVYVFAGREGYLTYAQDLGRDLEDSAGMYSPLLRELALWAHADRTELWSTVKHEGFHQYVHNFVDNAPWWFDEGYAEYFGHADYKNGRLQFPKKHPDLVRALRKHQEELTPLPKLLSMSGRDFMKQTAVHYPQSWALVQYLRAPDDRALRNVLRDYFEALKAGDDRNAAYTKVFAPIVDDLQKQFDTYVRELVRE